MIFNAQDFSRFEVCPKIPQLQRVFEPPRWPVRDGVKMFLESGIRALMIGESPDETVARFIAHAANPGFTYPDGEAYVLAQDHAFWLDGALRMIQEEYKGLEQLPLFRVGEHHVVVDGWSDGERVHIFRASTNLGGRELRWPELVLSAMDGREVCIHIYRLPSAKNGRILSPLSMAYQHPTFQNIQYRLARLYDEPEFNKRWKKIARWEIQPNPEWDEWRRGIDKDKCLDSIRETYTISPTLNADERQRLIYDIEQMCVAMERPSMYPRFRERCPSCVWKGLCHGDQYDRSEYQVLSREELKRYEQRLTQISS